MRFRVLGDVHGKFRSYKRIIRDVPRSIQVGDMGVGFYYYDVDREIKASQNPPYDSMSKGDHRFIRGNHDNPRVCATQRFWIPDASVVDGIFLMGGAHSIDREYRTEGLDWWADEELSYEELSRAIDVYASTKPDVVITHECPDRVANEYLAWANKAKIMDGSRTRQALDRMYEIHQPRLWLFGHWHQTFRLRLKGNDRITTFQCLGELDHCDVEWEDDEIKVTMPDGHEYEC